METMQWSEQMNLSHEGPPAPTIKNHSVTHFNGYLYCFGGYDGRQNHDTLLIYSIQEQQWIRPNELGGGGPGPHNQQQRHDLSSIVVTGSRPAGRNGHSATLATDQEDEDHARIIIIGGWLGTGPLAASDTQILDISNGGRSLRWFQPAVKGTPPGPCNMHSADYIPQLREVYVFRGGNGREYLNDLHAFSTETLTWRKVQTSGAHPQQRANHSSAILEETGELFIFGGWNGTERLNDIHILDTSTSTWTCPRAGGVLPHPRAGMTLTPLRGRLYLFGGSGTSSRCFHDLQILDRQEMTWLDVTQYEAIGHIANGNMGTNHGLQPMHFDGNPRQHTHRNDVGDFETPTFRFNAADRNNGSLSMQDSDNIIDMDLGTNDVHRYGGFTASRADWQSREIGARPRGVLSASPANPNDELSVPAVVVNGSGPGRRAGHTATAVNRKIYVFGGSCGSDYLNDFYVLDTDPAPVLHVTEPTSLHLLERRLRHFFNDEEFSDVTFIVQGQRVHGHKMVLSIVSDCFRAMFTAGFRESESIEIEIPDCSYVAFLAVMEYIYTGTTPKLDLQGPEREMNLSLTVDILELADRFFLDNLKQICEMLLQPAVTMETCEYLLQVAQKTNSIQLEAVCEHHQRNRDTI